MLTLPLALALAAPAQAAFPGQNGKIAFDTGRPGGPFNIEVINPDGTGAATSSRRVRDPDLVTGRDEARVLRGDGLYVANADGSNATTDRGG